MNGSLVSVSLVLLPRPSLLVNAKSTVSDLPPAVLLVATPAQVRNLCNCALANPSTPATHAAAGIPPAMVSFVAFPPALRMALYRAFLEHSAFMRLLRVLVARWLAAA